jgi:hypothetical protein
MRQPRTFVGLAGVYDIAEHLKFEQWRGVAALSCMTPANGGPEAFGEVSAVRLFENLAQEVGTSGSEGATSAKEERFFLGEGTEASRAVNRAEEREGETKSVKGLRWKEWPFSPVIDSALAKGGRLGGGSHMPEHREEEITPASDGGTSVEPTSIGREAETPLRRKEESAVRLADAMPLVVLESSPGDTTVPIDTTVALARTLKHLGCRVKNLVYDNVGHADFVIWPRKFEGEEALGAHIRDLLRVVQEFR